MTARELRRVRNIMGHALAQIAFEVGASVMFSWGISRIDYILYKEMPTLKLRVSGLLHDGFVLVSLNEGKDLYEIRLADKKNNTVKTIKDVYGDMLGSFIDENVERGDMTEAEYKQRCLNAI